MNGQMRMRQRVGFYHDHSKHRPDRYAPGPGQLDWANQPDPFRSYAGAHRTVLPLVADRLGVLFHDLYGLPEGEGQSWPLTLEGVAALLELSLGLSAWKVYGESRWALRCNPSSGNLHPTEGYVVVPTLHGDGLEGGVHHYCSQDHVLEQRRLLVSQERTAWDGLFPTGHFVLGLTSVHWREAWKYGDRAYRYCQLDVGHAMAAVRYAAACLGWRVRLLLAPATKDVGRLLGVAPSGVRFERLDAEREHADLLMQVGPLDGEWTSITPKLASVIELAGQGPWLGTPNRLSRDHGVEWPLVDEMAEVTRQPWLVENERFYGGSWPDLIRCREVKGADLIRQRRSAQRFDPQATLGQTALWRILDATLPRFGQPPWDLLPWNPRVCLVVMVHRVVGLAAGLYVLVRTPERLVELQADLDPDFLWQRVPEAPMHLPFYLLREGELQEQAYRLSCQQEIAADGVLTLGMLAAFPEELPAAPWLYRQLYWEAGAIGQTLYLEAEAAGHRGTGIGCFLDDLFHELLGLRSDRFQSVYHFTMGRPLIDYRLRTEMPYARSRS
ncbi:MAG: nitroreductase [Magnetococcales bacterium]|nr:nitroreductase [Magnetococcales bacterium]